MMSVEELLKAGLLKRTTPSKTRAAKSLLTAERYLSRAKKNFEIGFYDISIIAAYSSLFHASRAILFSDGFAERSHVAVYEYLREKRPELGGNVKLLDLYRKLRHSIAYGLDVEVGKEDANEIIKFAVDYVPKVRKLLRL